MAKKPPKDVPTPPAQAETPPAPADTADAADVTQSQASEARDITRETEQELAKTEVAAPPATPERWTQPAVGSKENPTASVGRIVHVHSPAWEGPRAGIIVGTQGVAVDSPVQYVCVNVFFDGGRDELLIQQCRARPEGNTFQSTPIIVNPDEAEAARERFSFVWWATWPPRV
jgi:hypothetical protein